jgi:hypothetical protein
MTNLAIKLDDTYLKLVDSTRAEFTKQRHFMTDEKGIKSLMIALDTLGIKSCYVVTVTTTEEIFEYRQ